MREFTVFFIILIVATILYIYLERRSLEVNYQKSESYGNVFLVRKASDQIDAANLLDNICNNITILITHLLKNKGTYNSKYVDGIYRFKNNFNKDNKYYKKTEGGKFNVIAENKYNEYLNTYKTEKHIGTLKFSLISSKKADE